MKQPLQLPIRVSLGVVKSGAAASVKHSIKLCTSGNPTSVFSLTDGYGTSTNNGNIQSIGPPERFQPLRVSFI
jgi:hypothetical protein